MATLLNRVGVATATAGSSTIVLGAALAAGASIFSCSFQDQITAGASGGQTLAYLILDSNGAWEYGQGTYTSSDSRLTRTLGQSATGALLSLSGNSQVFLTARASDILNPANNLSDVLNSSTALSNIGGVPTTRTLTAAGIVTGGGDLSANRTFTVTAAVQADEETGTSNTVATTPGVQHFHPSTVKAWAQCTLSGTTVTVNVTYNVSGVTRTGVGIYRFDFTNSFSTANYSTTAISRKGATNDGQWAGISRVTAPTSSGVTIATTNDIANAEESVQVCVQVCGDL